MAPPNTLFVLGLGYVGLPLAVLFGRRYRTYGYDESKTRIAELTQGLDRTGAVSSEALRTASHLHYTTRLGAISEADIVILCVPTPVDALRQPDLSPLRTATENVGRHMKPGSTVVFESTVYPGVTEEVCVPLLARCSGLRWKRDFFVAYSPERVNPGDPEHGLERVTKVVAGDTGETLERVAEIYESIVDAGVFRASSLRVAEAAKVIENTQRDVNIALVNELSSLLRLLGLDTLEVLEAASSKWNFLPFRPGLVGGHCVGVDPYYLAHKALEVGYRPELVLTARSTNEAMAGLVAKEIQAQMRFLVGGDSRQRDSPARVLFCGVAFKEDCPDLRNSKAIELARHLQDAGDDVIYHDPLASADEAFAEYGLELRTWQELSGPFDVLVVAVAHSAFLNRSPRDFLSLVQPRGLVVDLKGVFSPTLVKRGGYSLWRL